MRQLDHSKALGQLKEGERTAQVRFVNTDGETEVWIVAVDPDGFGPRSALRLSTSQAFIDDQVDARIGLQAGSIERLSKHLRWHHEELGQVMADDCTYLKREQSGFGS